ncbi:MAG: glycine cleavage system protein GcvH [Geminicoccaceae bacterium]
MTLRYTKDHEWIRVEGDIGVIGISRHAQEQLGDVVFVELPEVGRDLAQGDESGVVESVKSANEIYAPVSGHVVERNAELEASPGLANEDAEGKGWFYKIRLSDPSQLDALMSEADYASFVESQS